MSLQKPGIEVYFFQRKPRISGNFSLEFIFDDVRWRLRGRIQSKVIIASYVSNGFIKRVQNMLQAWKHQGPINHVTGDIHYITLLMQKKKTILTILDCGFMYEPNPLKRWVFRWVWLKWPVRKSACITAISEKTKQDIILYSGCKEDKIIVIPVAIAAQYLPAPKEFNDKYPVLLQIGTAPNKNISRVIEAIYGLPCKLIIIGKINEEQKAALTMHHIDYVNKFNLSQEEILQAYIECDIVVFASTFEGFGMPILEANSVERPVIAGDNSSMPSVGGNAACYVDALSVPSIRAGIDRIIQDTAYRNQLIINGRENRKRFDADHIADMYYHLYEQLYEQLYGDRATA